jgi:hypothetical protein
MQSVKEEPYYMMTSEIYKNQQESDQDDNRLVCIRILNVDSDAVHTTTTATSVTMITTISCC